MVITLLIFELIKRKLLSLSFGHATQIVKLLCFKTSRFSNSSTLISTNIEVPDKMKVAQLAVCMATIKGCFTNFLWDSTASQTTFTPFINSPLAFLCDGSPVGAETCGTMEMFSVFSLLPWWPHEITRTPSEQRSAISPPDFSAKINVPRQRHNKGRT